VLENLLRLAHPIMPFITEEIWQRVAPIAGAAQGRDSSDNPSAFPPSLEVRGANVAGAGSAGATSTIMQQPFPTKRQSLVNEAAEREMAWVMQFILGIRKIKGEMNIAPAKPVPVLLANAGESDRLWVEQHRAFLDFLARIESIEVLAPGDEGPESATALVGDMKILIPLAGLIDKEAEGKRLEKEIAKLSAEVDRLGKKLANPHFVDKAPEAVVQKERGKLSEANKALSNLQAQLDKIRAL
jgi:valyl-tRNA synthetase